MAQQLNTSFVSTVIPGAYVSTKVLTTPAGLAVSGVLTIVGEADMGPAFSEELDISENFFGPDDLGAIIAKYGGGRIVDAARIAATPMIDPEITGAPNAIYVVKTNVSAKASASMLRSGLTAYGSMYDQSFGEPGNSTRFAVTSTAESAPSVQFAYMPAPETGGSDDTALAIRINGGAQQLLANIGAGISPTAFVGTVSTGLNSLAGISATGGLARGVLTGAGASNTLGVVATGNSIVVTLGGTGLSAWGTTPSVGDTLVIGTTVYSMSGLITETSMIAGAANANVGAYVVTAATATTITATKIHNGLTVGLTAPVTVTAAVVGSEYTDVLCYSPVTMSVANGTARGMLAAGNVGATITGTASGTQLLLTLGSGSWAATPAVGDFLFIPSTAPAAWLASGANSGFFTVTAATATTVTLTRLSNGSPASFVATAIAATTNLVLSVPSVDGVSKTLEMYDGGDDYNISTTMVTTAGAAVSFLSTQSAPITTASSAERQITVEASRQFDGASESITTVGGDVALQLGYTGTTCAVTVTDTLLTTTPVGGVGAALSITLKNFKTIGALAEFINSRPGYSCSAGSNLVAQQQLFYGTGASAKHVLDRGTFAAATQWGAQNLRLKRDAYAFFSELVLQSSLLQLGNPAAAASAGLPEDQSVTFLTGGSRGATTNASVTAALAACEKIKTNMVAPLFSRDATLDVADGETDAASTYTIAAVHAALKAHVTAMSTVKRKRNRQGFASFNGTFSATKAAANTLAAFRVAMPSENFKGQDSAGNIVEFQSWGTAVNAASAQLAGFYKSIFGKAILTSGIVAADSTFDPNNDTQVEDAIKNGILVARARDGGGFEYVVDQTTYAVDGNFVFNSIQAVYAMDLISLTVGQRMERAFKGQSLADVSAAAAQSVFATIMSDLKTQKLIGASSDTPTGYKNASFRIVGPTMYVKAELKLATCLYFIPIELQVSEITQTA